MGRIVEIDRAMRWGFGWELGPFECWDSIGVEKSVRRMADEVKNIITADSDSKAIRDEWGAKVKTVRPILAEDRARRAGIDRRMASMALQSNYTGTLAGVYREGIELIPIIARAPDPLIVGSARHIYEKGERNLSEEPGIREAD